MVSWRKPKSSLPIPVDVPDSIKLVEEISSLINRTSDARFLRLLKFRLARDCNIRRAEIKKEIVLKHPIGSGISFIYCHKKTPMLPGLSHHAPVARPKKGMPIIGIVRSIKDDYRFSLVIESINDNIWYSVDPFAAGIPIEVSDVVISSKKVT